MKIRTISVLLFVLMFYISLGSSANTTILQDANTENIWDVYVSKSSPTSNFGLNQDLQVQDDIDGTFIQRFYIMFNISSISEAEAILNASICFNYTSNVGDASQDNYTISTYHITDNSWDNINESSITWNNQICGTEFNDTSNCNTTKIDSQLLTYGSLGWYCWDITEAVSKEHLMGSNNISLIFKADNETSNEARYEFCSKEEPITTGRPYINITYTMDNTKPSVTINSISTIEGSQTITFNSTETDSNNIICKYSIFNSTGSIDGTNENVSYTCGILQEHSATTTTYGNFNLTIYAIDEEGNENSSTQNFTTSESNGTTIITGGGGGSTIIIISAETNWTMEAGRGIGLFEIEMSISAERDFEILLENLGESTRTITLSCEDITGEACQYVQFQNQTIELENLNDVTQTTKFKLIIPQDAQKEDYEFNIIGTDENGATRSVTVFLGIGTLNIIPAFITKVIFESTTSGFPYIGIFLITMIISLLITSLIFKKGFPLRGVWMPLVSLILSISVVSFF